MPNKGYKPSTQHRAHLRRARSRYQARVHAALASYQSTTRPPKPDPPATPIPPSASKITSDLPQRWAVYAFNAEGQYYYKQEQADTLLALQKLIRTLALVPPLWVYVKSARTPEELGIMPIRIPASALPTLGARFQKYKEHKK